MKYKGHTYKGFVDQDESKMWHVHEITYNGRLINHDYSQYFKMTVKAFRLLVDLDFPVRLKGRVSVPWNEQSLVEYKEEIEYTKGYTIENDQLSEL